MSARDFVIRRARSSTATASPRTAPSFPVEKEDTVAVVRGWIGLEGAVQAEFRAFGVVCINERPRAELRGGR